MNCFDPNDPIDRELERRADDLIEPKEGEMATYNGKCVLCGHEQEVIVSKTYSEGELLPENCEKCSTATLYKVQNTGNVGLKGLTTPGKGTN